MGIQRKSGSARFPSVRFFKRNSPIRIIVLIPAAGSGSRIGGKTSKQFLEIGGKAILLHTLERFQNCEVVDNIIVAVRHDALSDVGNIIAKNRITKVREIVIGGKHRQDSVFNALQKVQARPDDIILVHDAVRPFVTDTQIRDVVRACQRHKAAVLAVPVKDTVKQSDGQGFFEKTLDRTQLWLVQTPQAFRYDILVRAYERAYAEKYYATDDANLLERLGVKVKLVEGSYENIKITTPEDLELAEVILKRWRHKTK